jgi:signal recognition particle GTPase
MEKSKKLELEDYKEIIARIATHGDIHTLMELQKQLRERSKQLTDKTKKEQ